MSSYGGRGPMLNAVLWIESVLATVFVLSRCYTRLFIMHSAGIDDFCLLLALLLLIAYSACISAGTAYGIGQKRAEIEPAEYPEAMKLEIIAQALCIFNLVTSKAAVAFLLLRFAARTWHRIFVWFCVVTNAIMATFLTIAVFIQCIPVESVWRSDIQGNCWLDFTTAGITVSAYAVCIDFALATIPCFIVWELNMKTKDKIVTICGLSLGVFAGICGVLRTTALKSLSSFEEYTFDTVDMLIYSGTENFVSALCASIPVIRPLWTRIVHGYVSSDGSHSSGRGYKLGDMRSNEEGAPGNNAAIGGSPGMGPETLIYARGFRDASDNNSEYSILRTRDAKDDDHGNEIHCRTEFSLNSSAGEVDVLHQPDSTAAGNKC